MSGTTASPPITSSLHHTKLCLLSPHSHQQESKMPSNRAPTHFAPPLPPPPQAPALPSVLHIDTDPSPLPLHPPIPPWPDLHLFSSDLLSPLPPILSSSPTPIPWPAPVFLSSGRQERLDRVGLWLGTIRFDGSMDGDDRLQRRRARRWGIQRCMRQGGLVAKTTVTLVSYSAYMTWSILE